VGLIFPAVLWEFLLGTVITGYDLRVGNILLNVVITAVTVFLLTLQSKTNEAL
jgi:hypothetical protein